MQTNVEIDDDLITEALKLSGLPTQKAVIEEGLKQLIKLRRQVGFLELFGQIPMDNDLETSRRS